MFFSGLFRAIFFGSIMSSMLLNNISSCFSNEKYSEISQEAAKVIINKRLPSQTYTDAKSPLAQQGKEWNIVIVLSSDAQVETIGQDFITRMLQENIISYGVINTEEPYPLKNDKEGLLLFFWLKDNVKRSQLVNEFKKTFNDDTFKILYQQSDSHKKPVGGFDLIHRNGSESSSHDERYEQYTENYIELLPFNKIEIIIVAPSVVGISDFAISMHLLASDKNSLAYPIQAFSERKYDLSYRVEEAVLIIEIHHSGKNQDSALPLNIAIANDINEIVLNGDSAELYLDRINLPTLLISLSESSLKGRGVSIGTLVLGGNSPYVSITDSKIDKLIFKDSPQFDYLRLKTAREVLGSYHAQYNGVVIR